MASSYSELKFELPATGEQLGTWGITTNENVGIAINEAIAGVATVTIDGNTVLTWLNTPSSQPARHYVLKLVPGTVAAPFNLVVPTINKPYVIHNATAYPATVKTSAGTGVLIPAGKNSAVLTVSSGVEVLFNYLPGITLGTSLNMASGGTNATAIAAGIVTSNGTALSSVPSPSGDLVGTTATQSLTNKYVVTRVASVVSVTNVTPNPAAEDMIAITAQSGALSVDAPGTAPANGAKFILRVTAASLVPLTFASGLYGYRGIGVGLPATLASGTTYYFGCLFNTTASKWDVVAVSGG